MISWQIVEDGLIGAVVAHGVRATQVGHAAAPRLGASSHDGVHTVNHSNLDDFENQNIAECVIEKTSRNLSLNSKNVWENTKNIPIFWQNYVPISIRLK